MAKFATSSIRVKGSTLRGDLLQEKGPSLYPIHVHSSQTRPDNFDDSIPGKIFEGEMLITTLLKENDIITLPMPSLLSSEAQGRKVYQKMVVT